jgi:hypothetical protein
VGHGAPCEPGYANKQNKSLKSTSNLWGGGVYYSTNGVAKGEHLRHLWQKNKEVFEKFAP